MKTRFLSILSVVFLFFFTSIANTSPNQTVLPPIKTYLDRFLAIACNNTANRCVAIGFGKDPLASSRLVYTTDDAGVTWNEPIPLHSPTAALNDDKITSPHPAKISCDDAGQRCVIVSAALINNLPTPIVYKSQDGGLTWGEPLVLSLPKVVNNKQPYHYPAAIDTHISCDYSGINCVIAATVKSDTTYTPVIYTTHNAGNTWALTKNFKDKSSDNCVPHGTKLTNVHCDSSGFFCMAVGFVIHKNSFWNIHYSSKPVVYTTEDGGIHWSEPVILPIKSTNTNASTLNDVSCSKLDKKCTAIGYIVDFKTNQYDHFAVVTNNGGMDWEAITPISSNTLGSALDVLKCDDSGDNCTAIGWYNKQNAGETVFKPLIYQKIAGEKEWLKNAQGTYLPYSSLKDLFCNADSHLCIAVGVQTDLSDTNALRRPIVSLEVTHDLNT